MTFVGYVMDGKNRYFNGLLDFQAIKKKNLFISIFNLKITNLDTWERPNI